MYPFVVTVIHKVSTLDEDTYINYVLQGVYIQATLGIVMNGMTFALDETTLISTNDQLAHSYGTNWQCDVGDRVMLGEYTTPVTSFGDIPNAWVVKSVEKNIANTDLDSIVIHVA